MSMQDSMALMQKKRRRNTREMRVEYCDSGRPSQTTELILKDEESGIDFAQVSSLNVSQ